MRQQLRLRVVLPVAVLALLGAGIGAYASGGGGSEGSEFVVTHKTKPKAAPGVAPAVWARKANAICSKADAQYRALAPRTVVGLETALNKALPIAEQTDEQLAALGFPTGRVELAKDFLRKSRSETAAARDLLAAIRRGDGNAFRAAGRRLAGLGSQFDRLAHRLGADVCAESNSTGAEPTKEEVGKAVLSQPAKALNLMLLERPVVVAVFYRPDGGVDAASVLEARAAALEMHAGFLPVNVKRNAAVSALASKYEVWSSPAVLILTKGPKLVARFDGFVDRKTVEQAVASAAR